jgi:hypothetical protein
MIQELHQARARQVPSRPVLGDAGARKTCGASATRAACARTYRI